MQKKYLYFMSAAHLCCDINSGAFPAALPFFVTYYGLDYTSAAGLMFAYSFLASFIQPLFGWLADRFTCYWLMGLGVLLAGMGLAATGFMTDYWAIFAAVTCLGIGSSIFHPEAARLVNKISGSQRGEGMSIFSVGGNGGFGLGPLLAVALLTSFGVQGTAFFGLIGIVMGTALFFLIPRLARAAAAAAQTMPQPATAGSVPHAAAAAPSPINDWPAFLRLTLVIITRSVVFCGINSFLPLFCIQVLHASTAAGSSALSVLSLASIAATLIGGRLADRWGYARILKYGCVFLVPLLLLVIDAPNIWIVYALLLPMSLAMQGPYAAFVVLGQSYLAKSIGFASGVTLGLSFSVGGIVVPALGWYADAHGIQAVMLLILAISAVCAASTFLLREPKK